MKNTIVLLGILLFGLSLSAQTHVFKPLPYGYDALEPYIDAQTMEIHYSRHHQGYYNKFMATIKGNAFLERASMADIFARIDEFPDAVRNNGGGYWNHEFFWEGMTNGGKPLPDGELKNRIVKQYGSFEEFVSAFSESALSVFGSGWTWLIADENGLQIVNTANQDNPLMNTAVQKGIPLLALDVWEHAYYLKYQNKRSDYIANFLKVVDWQKVDARYRAAQK
ncbi:MAG: superoxide dismutase [Bacteroidetes bacterium HGW-Bacteroidetes-6]|jgi:Fe-Mn family superoxide dismutase|nr:MAG: superoxide dismutase [Bacteroidetes bacterium HGW-Bacteroidetes-6]